MGEEEEERMKEGNIQAYKAKNSFYIKKKKKKTSIQARLVVIFIHTKSPKFTITSSSSRVLVHKGGCNWQASIL